MPLILKSLKAQQNKAKQNIVKSINGVLISLLAVLIFINNLHHYNDFSNTSCLYYVQTNLQSPTRAAESILPPSLDSLTSSVKCLTFFNKFRKSMC